MRKKSVALSVLLLFALLLPSCAPTADIPQDTDAQSTWTETAETVPDPLEALRASGEE